MDKRLAALLSITGRMDGYLYRWHLPTNTFSEQIVLTPGLGEAYTPTLSGPDGQVYAINNATLFAVGSSLLAVPSLPGAPALSLSAPRPNPFTRSTALQFQLASAQSVTAEVIDLSGHRVRLLVDGVLAAGVHTLAWDGRDAHGAARPPGIYFVRVSDGARVAARKVLLTR